MNQRDFKEFVKRWGTYEAFANAVNTELDLLWCGECMGVEPRPSRMTTQSVSLWINRRESPVPPPEYVRAIVRAARVAGIDVDEHKLRPDVYGKPALDAAA